MRVGFLTGCFDVFHEGHHHLLTQARNSCDFLIVAVNTDESVKRLKGEERPRRELTARMLQVNSYADACIPFDGRTVDLIRAIRPDVLIKGWDQDDRGSEYVDCLVRISQLPGFSTTKLLEAA